MIKVKEDTELYKKFEQIIPPPYYEYRHEFNNEPLIDDLNVNEKAELKSYLLTLLERSANDINQTAPDDLVLEALVYLDVKNACHTLYKFLENAKLKPLKKLFIASSIYQLISDDNMINVALQAYEEIKQKGWQVLIHSCYYLAKFKSEKTKAALIALTKHKDYLVAYNAKRSIELYL